MANEEAPEGGNSADAPAGVFELPELAGPLGDVNPGDLSYHEATRALVSAGQLIAWAEGLKARLVIRLCDTAAGTVPQADPVGPNRNEEGLARMNVEAEVSGALTLAGKTAQKLVFESNELVGSFPSTLDRLESGTLNREQAMVIVNQAQTLPEDAQAEFEQELLSEAPGLPRPKLSGKASRLRERMHPDSIARRKEKAACDRRIYLQPGEDGMAWFGAYLPAEAATAAFNRINSAARNLRGPDEERTGTQLCADVFTDLLLGAGFTPAGPIAGRNDDNNNADNLDEGANPGDRSNQPGGRGGNPAPGSTGTTSGQTVAEPHLPNYDQIKAEVLVTVPVLTLLGLSEEPAELEGYGPMDDETARKLCAGASSFKRILTHPETGAMISFGRDTYKVPADLKRMIQIRDRCCRAPGCNRAAMFTELDHTKPWAAGGTTDYESVKCYCAKHHLLKTACGWKDTQDKDGTITSTSPAGRTYTTKPEGPVLTSRKDARRYRTDTGHRFDPWDPKNVDNTPTGDQDQTPPPF
ncbi:HNH endonuclease signature motif containing protein [Arthrobacter sp. H14]|uniref:HNH endonuclease signature motif containing protein n=1 Tax=Arthrobacter sp. H14 TaxID=1312959 RepID=UPI00047BE846|nr:HNH endonuclease signature motif containing protein [Arthrobacter sp. H14]